MRQLFQLPNLLSLSRIALLWPVGHFIAGDTQADIYWCLLFVFIAGLTDGLDGILARKMNQVSRLGIALDPFADKIFIGGLVLMAIIYRDFPVWLAILVIGRDLAIIIAGALLMRGTKISLPSNITGKYTFGALVNLLFSYIIRFEFGIVAATIASVLLLVASTLLYARIMFKIRRGIPINPPRDPRWLQLTRLIGSWIYLIAYILIWLYQNTRLFST